MLIAEIIVMAISGMVIAFCSGYLTACKVEDERLSARVIRPANITVNRHIHITEYTVADKEALEIDFPNSKRG